MAGSEHSGLPTVATIATLRTSSFIDFQRVGSCRRLCTGRSAFRWTGSRRALRRRDAADLRRAGRKRRSLIRLSLPCVAAEPPVMQYP